MATIEEAAVVPLLEIPERMTPTPTIKYAQVETPDAAPTSLLGWLPIVWSRVLFGGTAPAAESWKWPPFLCVFLLSGLLLYPCLSFHLFEPDEGRYAQIPREMLETGEWIVPTLQGEPYLDKPPLLYWLTMLSYAIFGCHDWAARLVPALAMHGSVLLIFLIGRRMVGSREALWGAILLTVSPIFLAVGRLLVLDGLLSLWVTLALLSSYRAQAGRRLSIGWWMIAATACGLGVLTKGPVALALVLPPFLLTRFMTETPTLIGWRAWATFALIVLAVNLPWYAAVCVQRPEFAAYFLGQHNVERFIAPFDHVRPVWFYVPILMYGLLPIALLAWPIARFLTSTRSQETNVRCPALGFLLLAGMWCVFFFSLAGSKLPTYILPAFPPLCLALGCFLARTGWQRSRWVIGMIALAWLIQAGANYVAIPMFASSKSPMQDSEAMCERCSDPNVPIVCFPRNVDSVAFYTGRRDLQTFRSKDVVACIQFLEKHPRTVVLFGHRSSPATLEHHLPPHLKLIDRRPMGLCESAIVVRSD